MADENTTASTSTTTEAPASDQSQATGSETSSTTETSPPSADDSGTILTSTAADTEADNAADGTGDSTSTDGDDNSDDNSGEPAENAELFGAPEGSYELEGLPEGTVVDTKALEAIEPIAKKLGLSNKGLSKIAGVYAEKVLPQVAESFSQELERNVIAQRAAWATEATDSVKTDEVFGGRPLSEVQQVSAKALDRFGGEDFRKFLDETGLGNHPAMLKFAYSAGSAISEDTTFERGNGAPRTKTREEKYYPDAKS